MGIYHDLRGLVLVHRKCGSMKADVGPQTNSGYRVLVKCGCGTDFKRWVTPEGAEENLLPSALLALEN